MLDITRNCIRTQLILSLVFVTSLCFATSFHSDRFDQSTSVIPCQYYSPNHPHSFTHISLRNLSNLQRREAPLLKISFQWASPFRCLLLLQRISETKHYVSVS